MKMWEVIFRTHVWEMINTRMPTIDQGTVLGEHASAVWAEHRSGIGQTKQLPSSPDPDMVGEASWSAS